MTRQLRDKYEDFTVVDLFCGVGALTHGFILENFNVSAGIDLDSSCRYAYEENNSTVFVNDDLSTMSSEEIEAYFPEKKRRILVGCAPCQAFSTYGQRYKNNDKWKLLTSFGRVIRDIQPEIVSMENVPSLKRYRNGEVFQDFVEILNQSDYHVWFEEVNAQNFGVPQKRTRLILLASKLGPIQLVPHTHDEGGFVSVREAIGHLPEIRAGESHETDRLHRARALSPLNMKRIRATPEGGSWKDWNQELILECHKRASGKTYKSVYGRMSWDVTAPTLTTQCTGYGNGRYGHPKQDRAISLREAAILQSFPEDYSFLEDRTPMTTRNTERHIGNAVPVLLSKAIAQSIKKHIEKYA